MPRSKPGRVGIYSGTGHLPGKQHAVTQRKKTALPICDDERCKGLGCRLFDLRSGTVAVPAPHAWSGEAPVPVRAGVAPPAPARAPG